MTYGIVLLQTLGDSGKMILMLIIAIFEAIIRLFNKKYYLWYDWLDWLED